MSATRGRSEARAGGPERVEGAGCGRPGTEASPVRDRRGRAGRGAGRLGRLATAALASLLATGALAHSPPPFDSDLAVLGGCFGQPPQGICARFDLDGDGRIDFHDFALFRSAIAPIFAYDLNGDWIVDTRPAPASADRAAFESCVGQAASGACAAADYDGSGAVDAADRGLFEAGLLQALDFDFTGDGVAAYFTFVNHRPEIRLGDADAGFTLDRDLFPGSAAGFYAWAFDADGDTVALEIGEPLVRFLAPLPTAPVLDPVLLGDVDGDGAVTAEDVAEIEEAVSEEDDYEPRLDLDSDGLVDGADVALARSLRGQSRAAVFVSLRGLPLGRFEFGLVATDEHGAEDRLTVRLTVLDPAALEHYDDYEDVLVVVNDEAPVSQQIADAFVAAREIPAENVVHISAPPRELVPRSVYEADIRAPIADYLENTGLARRIDYIVTTKGVPLRVAEPKLADNFSVDAGLTTIGSPFPPTFRRSDRNGTPYEDVAINPYRGQEFPFSHATYGIYLVTRLTGYSVEDAIALIERASSARGSRGRFVFDVSPGRDNAAFRLGNDWLRHAAAATRAAGYDTLLDQSHTFVTGETGVLGYGSWGSNDGDSARFTQHAIPHFTWAPGSVASTIVSTSGRTFTAPPRYGQSLIADLIAEGASAAAGHVAEPFLGGVADIGVLFDRYVKGYNLADSYWMAAGQLSWMDVIVGDPKMRINDRLLEDDDG